MKSVTNRFIFCLLTLSSVWAHSQPQFGPENTFKLPRGHMLVAPSAERVVMIGPFSGAFYELSDDESAWLGPIKFSVGYYGTQETPKRANSLPLFGWALEPDGSEAFVTNTETKQAVVLQAGQVQYITFTGSLFAPLIEEQTGRLFPALWGSQVERKAAKAELYQDMRGRSPSLPGFVSRTGIRTELLPETLVGLGDISPQGDRLLCRTSEDALVGILNLHTGVEILLPIQNDRPRALPDHMSGSFSPDGEYVLMQYGYHPDDHYSGGYLQLFTKDGEYVEEVAKFQDDVGSPVGFHEWLRNNWIVYSTGKELVFRKFIAEP